MSNLILFVIDHVLEKQTQCRLSGNDSIRLVNLHASVVAGATLEQLFVLFHFSTPPSYCETVCRVPAERHSSDFIHNDIQKLGPRYDKYLTFIWLYGEVAQGK